MAAPQIQYPARTQPVGDPSDWVIPTFAEFFSQWNPPTQQPVRPSDYHQLESTFFQGEPDDFIVTAVPETAWLRDTEQPVLPVEYRYQIPSVFRQIEPADFVAPIFLADWVQPTEQPVRPVEYRYGLPSLFPPDYEPIISTPDLVAFAVWVQPTSQPVLPIEYRYWLPSIFAWIDEDDFAAPPLGPGGTGVPTVGRHVLLNSGDLDYLRTTQKENAMTPGDLDYIRRTHEGTS